MTCRDITYILGSRIARKVPKHLVPVNLEHFLCRSSLCLDLQPTIFEACSRQENQIFENMRQATERENTESALCTFLKTDLGYKDANTIEIQQVHGLGKKRDEDKRRPIIVRFLRYKDCEEILSLRGCLRGSTFRMYQDLPHEIAARRKR